MTDEAEQQATGDPTFISALQEGHQRFLAYAIEHSFVCGRRTAQDFIRHFPPAAIMKGLEREPELRAQILVLTTGLKQKIALKKEWQDAGTDLQIALDEGETDSESIVALFAPDDRVRYLDPRKIWDFLVEGDFWKASTSKGAPEVARNHVAFLIERALEDKLVSHRDIVEGVTVDELANRLPKSELGRLIQCALKNADKLTVFSESDLLSTTPPRTLVQYVPLSHLWDAIVVPKIAERHGYAAKREAAAPKEPEAPKPVAREPAPVPAPAKDPAKSALPKPKEAQATAKSADGSRDVSRMPQPAGAQYAKEASQSRLKAPAPDRKPDAADAGPGLAKTPQEYFAGDDDIDVMEDDVKAI